MGVDLELFPAGTRPIVDELFIVAQPAHVQKAAERKLTAEERDVFRADLLRQRLKDVTKPTVATAVPPEGPTELA
jgi:protein arginine kinase